MSSIVLGESTLESLTPSVMHLYRTQYRVLEQGNRYVPFKSTRTEKWIFLIFKRIGFWVVIGGGITGIKIFEGEKKKEKKTTSLVSKNQIRTRSNFCKWNWNWNSFFWRTKPRTDFLVSLMCEIKDELILIILIYFLEPNLKVLHKSPIPQLLS